VLYGLARQASLPAIFARIDPRTRTPLFSTAVVVAVILALALLIPLEALAEATSLAVLTSFTLVNLSLVRLKLARRAPPAGAFRVWAWVPVAGFLSCLGFFAGTIAALLGAF
jgi:amino acid transporter